MKGRINEELVKCLRIDFPSDGTELVDFGFEVGWPWILLIMAAASSWRPLFVSHDGLSGRKK